MSPELNNSKIFDVVEAWVTELSLAPMGHNHKPYLLVKAMDTKGLKKILAEEDPDLTEVLEKAGLFDESLEAGQLIGKLLKAYGDELPEGFMTVLSKAVGMKPPEEGAEGTEPPAGIGTSTNGSTKEPADKLAKALESASPELRDVVLEMHKAAKSAEDRAKKAEETANKLAKASTEAYFDRLVQEDFKGIPGDLKPLKKALATLNESHPIEVGFITSALKKASDLALAGMGGAGKTIQEGSSALAGAEAEIGRLSAIAMKKAPGMSREEAMALVLDEHPELYEQYEAERR